MQPKLAAYLPSYGGGDGGLRTSRMTRRPVALRAALKFSYCAMAAVPGALPLGSGGVPWLTRGTRRAGVTTLMSRPQPPAIPGFQAVPHVRMDRAHTRGNPAK